MTQEAVVVAPPDEAPSTLSHRQILVVFSGLMLGMLLAALDQTIVATALPTIVGDLGGLAHLSWVVTAYLLASTASTPLWGKLGDLYGRKRIFQGAIVVFLIGSALCGLSQAMWQLILFRGLQGLGGGGLIVTAQGLIADIVSPRERGRYQGIFGSVFGFSSVAGPLLGGFFVDNLSWHWVFYVNLPLGALALGVTAATLPQITRRVQHTIDYLGAVLVAGATTCLVLTMTLGGTTYPWLSAPILGFAGATLVLSVAVLFVEQRAAEPVLPLGLFRSRIFSVASGIAFVVGFAMLGATTFLPLFLQVVQGVSPTSSGLRLLPLMVGMLVTSIGSGQLISHWGRYKVFPIVGTAMITVGFAMLSRIDENTPGWVLSLDMLILGLGLGLVMQVLVIAVQNAVNYHDLGAATSGVTFFRSIGSVVGVALFGAVFSAELQGNLAGLIATGALPPDFSQGTIEAAPAVLGQLPPAIHAGIVHAYAAALRPIFLVALPFALVAFGLTWMLEEAPLRKTTHATDPGDVFGIPKSSASIDELARALAVLLSRESRQQMYLRLAQRAGLDLAPGASWLLFRIHDRPTRTPDELARQYSIPVDRVTTYLADLTRQGLVVDGSGGPEGGANDQMALSDSGQDRVTRLIEARRAGLAELLADWRPEQHDEITHLVNKLADPGRPDPEDGAARAA